MFAQRRDRGDGSVDIWEAVTWTEGTLGQGPEADSGKSKAARECGGRGGEESGWAPALDGLVHHCKGFGLCSERDRKPLEGLTTPSPCSPLLSASQVTKPPHGLSFSSISPVRPEYYLRVRFVSVVSGPRKSLNKCLLN